MSSDSEPDPFPPKRRGRPPGIPNKPREPVVDEPPPLAPPSKTPMWDYRAADPATIIARQLSMIDFAQQAMRNEMTQGLKSQTEGRRISSDDLKKLETLSNAIVRAVQALKQSADIAEEMAKRMTPEQLLEAALAKVEAQDTATLSYAIKRLRAHRERIAPVSPAQREHIGSASDAVTSLENA